MLVDLGTSLQRMQARTRSLGVVPRDLVARLNDPDHEDHVLVRYLPPPPEMQAEIQRRQNRRTAMRELVRVDINHVLLAACRKDQTAADATIQGTPSGAFTYHLCKVLREGGANLDRKVLIKRVEQTMAAEHFDQSPQLETSLPDGPLFPSSKIPETPPDSPEPPQKPKPSEETSAQPLVSPGAGWKAEDWQSIFREITKMPDAAQLLALEMLRGRMQPGAARARQITTGTRVLVYVHGICRHVAGFSDDWWHALQPFTTVFGEGDLGDTRREVVWSDLVNEKGLTLRATRGPASREVTEHEQAKREIIDTLQDRLERHAIEALPRTTPGEPPRALQRTRDLPSIPGLNCIDDFTVYLINDNTRSDIICRFTDVVRPLLQDGAAVDIISHSWGTVVAYEGLRQLEDDGLVTPRVNNFFTVGAALSIGAVRSRLRPGNQDGRRPAMVKHWVNVNARGDLVGGPLQGRPYAVDDDFPSVTPFGCSSFLTLVNPQCAHGSYFKDGNVEVNRDIFAAEINNA